MGKENAEPDKGKQAAEALQESAHREEEKTEAAKGSDLKKGADRFKERAESANGEGADKANED
jgi:hypothetical protein